MDKAENAMVTITKERYDYFIWEIERLREALQKIAAVDGEQLPTPSTPKEGVLWSTLDACVGIAYKTLQEENEMNDIDKEPTRVEKITDLVATMKACGTYRDVKVVKMDDQYAELEAEWITTNYGNTPETLEKIRLTVKF